jgi:hypothetical protein
MSKRKIWRKKEFIENKNVKQMIILDFDSTVTIKNHCVPPMKPQRGGNIVVVKVNMLDKYWVLFGRFLTNLKNLRY